MQFLRRIGIDTYMLLLVAMVCAGGLLPARGLVAAGLHHLTCWAVALLFLLYGAKLDLASIRAGLMNLRLQAACLATTYALFPALGLALSVLLRPVLGPELATVMPAGKYPIAGRVGTAVGEHYNGSGDPDAGFERGLQVLLDGLESSVAGLRSARTPGVSAS